MIPMLERFAQATHSYGWAIVLLTLLVRLLVWPLVANQTRSMMRMSQLQPQIKAIQERYQKTDPELFQKKTMEFYSKNKINPMGGCLPLLIQLPILLALFGTFTGPPFGDKPVEVKVKVVSAKQASEEHKNEVSGGGIGFVSQDHKLAKVIVYPGDSTVVQGTTIDFGTRALQGELPENFKVGWQIYGKGNEMKGIINHEPFGERFHATFPNTGEFVVKAMVPGVAKNESFLFINSLGKVAKGAELLHPSNWDSVVLILLFGVTMFISQKLSLPKQKPAGELDDAQLAQQQSMKIMPFAVTGMFFFIPLPTGVYLYMVISNVVQSLQTFLVMKQPVPEFVNVMDDTQTASAPSKSGSTSESKGKNSGIIKELSHKTGQPAIEPGNKEKSSADKKVVLGEAHILRADNGGGEILNIADANGDSLSEKRKKKKK
jgi:YidC/Oxa1 family membrane protein insertase